MTELKDLVGEHLLSGVDFFTEKSDDDWRHSDASACRFKLDGVIYCAVEDPSDGYRSCLRELVVRPNDRMENTFFPVRVFGQYRTTNGSRDCEILELIDSSSGQMVLEVGTDNSDDYYPSFVANFSPEAMSVNARVNAKIKEPEPKQDYSKHPLFGRFS